MKTLLPFLFLFLSPLTSAQELRVEFDLPKVEVTVFEYDGPPKICETITGKEKAQSCVVWNFTQKTCTIHAQRPKNDDSAGAFWLLGREFYHCLHGSYHP